MCEIKEKRADGRLNYKIRTYLRDRKIHMFGAAKSMNDDDLVLSVVSINARFSISKMSSITELDSPSSNRRTTRSTADSRWWRLQCSVNVAYKADKDRNDDQKHHYRYLYLKQKVASLS